MIDLDHDMAALDTRAPVAPGAARWHTLPGPEATRALQVERATGLTSEEAATRLAELGPNRLVSPPPSHRAREFARQYGNPAQGVLLAAAVASLALGEAAAGLVLLGVTCLDGVLGLRLTGRRGDPVAALHRSLAGRARARRDGRLLLVPAARLVPGDVVRLQAGDAVPADGRLLDSAMLEVDESALTGESLPVPKVVDAVDDADAPLRERTDMVYMATQVTRGAGEFVVTTTGMATEAGRIAGMLGQAAEPPPPLAGPVGQVTRLLLLAGAPALLAIAALGAAHGHPFRAVLTSAIAFAVAAVPTALPVVLSVALGHAARALAATRTVVRRSHAALTLGATSAIDVVTTGLMTRAEVTAVEMAMPGRRYRVSGEGYRGEGGFRRAANQEDVPLEPLVLPVALGSNAVLDGGEPVGGPTDCALLVLAEKAGLDVGATRQAFPRIATLPFDATYRLTATFHRMTDESGADVVRCFVLGTPDRLLGRARTILGSDLRPVRLDDERRRRYAGEQARMEARGLRVIATARRDVRADRFDARRDLLPLVDDLTLLMLVGVVDPPRPGARRAVAEAAAAGVQVRIVTADQPGPAQGLARRLGIPGRTVTGAQLAALPEDRATREIDGIGVVAAATPEHRIRIVELLRRRGHVVAATGSGFCDAPALEAADVGVAAGTRATESAKEAAEVAVEGAKLSSLVRAVRSGRELHARLVVAVRFQLATIAGLVLAFLGAAALDIGGGTPLEPLQTLFLAFTVVALQGSSLGIGPAAEPPRGRPGRWDEAVIDRASLPWTGVSGVALATVTLALMAVVEHGHGAATARTMALVAFGLGTLAVSLTAREERRSVFRLETVPDGRFALTTGAAFAAVLVGAETGLFNRLIGTTGLSFGQWLWSLCGALAVIAASELRVRITRSG